jgi:ribose transport system substrate-binding protein
VGVRAGAIITDSIPYAMALNPLVAAQAKNIPILITDQAPDPAHPSNALLGYLPGPGATQLTAVAGWIIADSGGRAKVLINMSTDSPSTLAYVAAAAALVNYPGIDYVISEFEQYLQPTIGGIRQSGQAARIRLASSAAQLDGLKMRTNIGDLALTPGAEESGAWFGSTGYVREYERLWGVG